jgi:hypothetical protein
MPTASLSRNQVRQNIGRSAGFLFGGRVYAVTTASPTQLDSVDLPVAEAETLLGKMVYIPTGGGAGQARTIVSALTASPVGVPSGSRVFLDHAFAPVPSTNALLEVWDRVSPQAVNELIGDAVRAVGTKILQHKEHIVDLLDGTFVYNLPESSPSDTGFAYLAEVFFEDTSVGDEIFTIRIPQEFYTVNADTTPRTIEFHRRSLEHLIATGRKAKLVGQRFPRVPEADSGIVEVDPEYVRASVLVRLWDGQPWNDFDRSRRNNWERYVNEYLNTVHTPVYPDSIRVESF